MKRYVLWLNCLVLLLAAVSALAAPAEKVNPTPKCNKRAILWRSLDMPANAHDGDIWINPIDGMEMVYIGKGSFRMGSNEVADERPYHKVSTKAYWIARYEVSVAQYRKFSEITKHPMAAMPDVRWLENSPIVNVDWNDAVAYGKWANGRLPSEAEWEKAARGRKSQIYPWGNAWDAARCNNGLEGKNAPMKVGSFPAGVSFYGVMDMAGNVSEWCDGVYEKQGDLMDYRVLRGGSCHDITSNAYRASRRDYLSPATRANVIGMRYVMDAR